MKKIVYFLVVLLLSQCKTNTSNNTGEFVEIDVSQKYPLKEIYLQDIAKVEYIPLETNDNTLMKSWAQIAYVSDDYIIATNTNDGDVFVFDGKGKSKFSFNRKGQGGMDYNNIYSIAFDEKAKEIFIFDRFSTNPKLLVYAEDGVYRRTLACPSDFQARNMFVFDDESLLVFNDFGLTQDKYSNKPYLFISKKDGSIVDTLDIHLSVRISDRVRYRIDVEGGTALATLTIGTTNNRSYGKNFLIADWSSDTIYRLTPLKELQPVIVRIPLVHNSDPKIVISNNLVTSKFIFLSKIVLDIEMAKKGNRLPSMDLLYDFETRQINEYKLINKDIETVKVGIYESVTPVNTGVYLFDVVQLIEADEAGKLKGDLKELLKKLDAEDNPVLVKIKF